jgi:hypothetical protein
VGGNTRGGSTPLSRIKPGGEAEGTMKAFDQAAAEIQSVLEGVARREETIYYSDLTRQIQSLPLSPDDPLLARLLDSVSRSTHASSRVMLSAVVILKGDEPVPGKGFFSLARELGHDVADDPMAKFEFHALELKAVHQAYSF